MKNVESKPKLIKNAIAYQNKTTPNSLTVQEWNHIINVLKTQTNLNTEYLDKLHSILFGSSTSDFIETPSLPDIRELITDLDNAKVDKVPGMSLISNAEITRLAGVDNYDDTEVRELITDLDNAKVDKVPGMSLISDTEISRLAGVDNYDDTEIRGLITTIQNIITSIDGEEDGDSVINKLHEVVALLNGYAEGTTLVNLLSGKVDKVDGKGLTKNELTDALVEAYNAAYTHSQSIHAPTNAQANVIEGVQVNGVDLSVANKKVNVTVPTIPDISLNDNQATAGKYISKIEVDATDKHKLIVTKADLPTLRPTIELEVASLTTLTEHEKLTIKNQLSSLIVDDKIDGTKFDDIVLVSTSDLIRLHYSSIDYCVANPQITVIFETESAKYILNVPLIDYTYSTLTSTSTTIPTISTSITTDATDDTKTASPKAVKTYVDNHDASELAHPFLQGKIDEAKAIAEGKVSAMSFETKAQLDAWLLIPENVETLIVGTNFYIEDLASPDYWWNGTTIVELSTDKIDLTEYAKKTELLTLGTTENDAYRGDLGQIAYNHSQSDHAPSNAQKNSDITKAEIEAKLTGEISSHSHALPTHNHDDRYYTESEVDTKLGGKANATHNHTKSQITDFPTTMTPTAHQHTKSEITDFPTIPTIPDITVNNGSAESGKYISQIVVDATNKHKLNITKENLPTLRPTIELEVASLTTLTELEKLTIKNQLSSLIVDDKIDGSKFDDIVLVTTSDLIRLHYSSIDYYVANPQITVIFETEDTKYTLHVPLIEYTYSSLTSTTTTIPTISTSITTDATSDTKTASPKAVKTYVDNAINSAILGLLGGES